MTANNSTDAPANPPCIAPRLIVSAGGHTVTHNAANIDDDAIADIRQQCDDSDGDISFDLRNLHAWPDVPRYKVLALLRGIGCLYSVSANGTAHANVFEATLASIVGSDDMVGHQMSMRAVTEAAALWFVDAADAAADRINERLEELGMSRSNRPQLAKRIRDAAGHAGTSRADAESEQALALAYHQQLIAEANVEANEPVLISYQDEFFSWHRDHWESIADTLLLTRIISFLQSRITSEIRNRLANDILANLKAFVLADCWNEAMPFMIDSLRPTAISHPNLLSFANGLVDLDELLTP